MGFAPFQGDGKPINLLYSKHREEFINDEHVAEIATGPWGYAAPGTFVHMHNGKRSGKDDRFHFLSTERRFAKGVVMLELLENSPERPMLDRFIEGLGMGPATRKLPCIAVHIRHGDACNKEYLIAGVFERTCYPLELCVHFVVRCTCTRAAPLTRAAGTLTHRCETTAPLHISDDVHRGHIHGVHP